MSDVNEPSEPNSEPTEPSEAAPSENPSSEAAPAEAAAAPEATAPEEPVEAASEPTAEAQAPAAEEPAGEAPAPEGSPEEDTSFSAYGLIPELVRAVEELGFTNATPIQQVAIPAILSGRDVVGGARTGSGKTAAFGLPLLQRIVDAEPGPPRALILAPTRELALQVTEALRSFAKRLPTRIVTIYGGSPYGPQLQALSRGVPVVVGTPGRVIDHIERGSLDLGELDMLVLDEADEMLRMGFIDDVDRIIRSANPERQVALFSATMPKAIRHIVHSRLNNPLELEVEESALEVGHIEQRWMKVPQRFKLDALMRVLTGLPDRGATLCFARTRKGCAEVADALARNGMAADALHGDLAQSARERVLGRFRAQRIDVVVATDVAARGIDVEHITHVINLDMPHDAETYVHRIGRTGRAGRDGNAITFITPGERRRLRFLQRDLGTRIQEAWPPTDAQIAAQQRQSIVSSLKAVPDESLPPIREWLSEMISEDWSAEDIAAAALQLVATTRGVSIREMPEEAPEPPRRAPRDDFDRRERPQRERRERPARGDRPDHADTELFFPIGENRRVRPGDLVGALANEVGVDGDLIGRITIVERKSFVAVPKDLADHILANHPTLQVRGIEVPVALAIPRDQRNYNRDRRGPPRRERHERDGERGGGGRGPWSNRRTFKRGDR